MVNKENIFLFFFFSFFFSFYVFSAFLYKVILFELSLTFCYIIDDNCDEIIGPVISETVRHLLGVEG